MIVNIIDSDFGKQIFELNFSSLRSRRALR